MDATTKAGDALCHAAKDVSLHIAGLLTELTGLRHPHAPVTKADPVALEKQLNRLKDQHNLLGAILSDIEKHVRASGS